MSGFSFNHQSNGRKGKIQQDLNIKKTTIKTHETVASIPFRQNSFLI
jgi:hypothetical protein